MMLHRTRMIAGLFFAVLLGFASAQVVHAAETASGGDSDRDQPVRVLITYGGHDFEEAAFWSMFDSMEGIQYDRMELPQAFDRLGPDLADQYDVLVRFDMLDGMTPEQRRAFVELLRDRGIGLVSLHHNLGSHRNWEDYREIIGGSYLFASAKIHGRDYEASDYHHWDRTQYTPVALEHPITKGIGSFLEIGGGETYERCYVADDVQVLLKTDQKQTTPEQMWVKSFGKSRIVYLMPGHGPQSWDVPEYREILRRAIIWSKDRP